jgi:hypothetical protein
MKIKAILDWEYAGFYPEWFERRFSERLGPSVAMGREDDDAEKIVDFLQSLEGQLQLQLVVSYVKRIGSLWAICLPEAQARRFHIAAPRISECQRTIDSASTL